MIKKFENYTKVNLSDLEQDWNAERILNAKKGKFPYMKKEGEWTKKEKFSRSEYPKIVFMYPEDAKQLNEILADKTEIENKYNHLLNHIKEN